MVYLGQGDARQDEWQNVRLNDGQTTVKRRSKKGVILPVRFRDGASGSEGIVGLDLKWSEQNGMTISESLET